MPLLVLESLAHQPGSYARAAQVGRIIEAIQQTGELDNTLIIYIAGDNGQPPRAGCTAS